MGYAADSGGSIIGSAGVSYDDFYVTRLEAVPEPSVLALWVGTALVAALSRQTRRVMTDV